MKALLLGLSIGVMSAALIGCEDDPRDLDDYARDAGTTHGAPRGSGSGGSGGSTAGDAGGSGGMGGSAVAGSGGSAGSAGTDDQDAG